MVNSPLPVHRRKYSAEYNENRTERYEQKTTEKYQQENKRLCSKYENIKIFHRTDFSKVYTATEKRTGAEIILKEIPKKYVTMEEYNGGHVPKEFKFQKMAAEKTNCVLPPVDLFERKGSFIIAMEKPADYMDLHSIISTYAPMDETSSLKILAKVVEACKQLQDAGIQHRDIKPGNILMHLKSLEIKIIDFGCAELTEKVTQTTADNQVGTLLFLPPEWYSHEHAYNPEIVTTWALGSIFYQLLIKCWDFQDGTLERDREFEMEHIPRKSIFIINRTLCDFRFRIKISDLLNLTRQTLAQL